MFAGIAFFISCAFLIDLWFRRKLEKYEQKLRDEADEKRKAKPKLPPDVQVEVDAFLAEMDRDLQETKG
jgi:hypothetical protein